MQIVHAFQTLSFISNTVQFLLLDRSFLFWSPFRFILFDWNPFGLIFRDRPEFFLYNPVFALDCALLNFRSVHFLRPSISSLFDLSVWSRFYKFSLLDCSVQTSRTVHFYKTVYISHDPNDRSFEPDPNVLQTLSKL